MRTYQCSLFTALACIAFCPAAVAQPSTADSLTHPALRTVLLGMAEIDQAVREEVLNKGFGNVDSLDVVRQQAVDETNVKLLSKVIRDYGWPTRKMVGLEGVKAAFLVVQHAPHEFQRNMLPEVHASYKRGDLPSGDYALLIDRVLLGGGFPQRYGTQAEIREGTLVILPLEDEANVDERRESLGLEPMYQYIRRLEALYGVKASPSSIF